ncbi:MAG TPA: FG-GAP-like repeat-containing protein, partial [Gemmataceae bacterium]|nr:FG-GAP-like repeat-containing protein [Gemmataceae bacterium]
MERLEARDLLAGAPLITAVTPLDGSTITQTTPAIAVTFNEDVKGANVAANFSLFDSTGAVVPINTAVYTKPAGGPFVTTLTYNNGQPLDSGSYSLYVRADQILDATAGSTLALSYSGQVVVANSGINNIATVNVSATGDLTAQSNLIVPTTGPTRKPVGTALVDLDLDGLTDMVVLDSGTNNVFVYAGQTGGVFKVQPSLTLALPAGAGASALATGDFDKNGFVDLIVANSALDSVSTFLNNGTAVGAGEFQPAVNHAAGLAPSGIAVADFNGDTNLDVAVSNSDPDPTNNFNVTVLPGSATGTFGTAVATVVGDTSPTGLRNPSGIAAGLLDSDNKPDLAVSGVGGIAGLVNTSVGGVISFTGATVATSDTTSVAIGVVRNTAVANPRGDIIATTNANNGQVIVLINDNTGNLFLTNPVAAGSNPTAVTVMNLDPDPLKDLVVVNNNASGTVTTLRNSSRNGVISATSANGVTPVVITSAQHGLTNGTIVLITGAVGNTAINGAFPISAVTPTTFTLAGVTANGTYTANSASWSVISFNSAITAATNNAGQPITITSTGHGLTTGQQVTVSGVLGNTGANGTFVVKVVDPNNFQLLGSTPTGAYTSGGTWMRAPIIVDTNPVAIAFGDINQDNKPDFVTANSNNNNVTIVRGNGDGSFQVSTNLALTPATQPSAVATGDVNGDGLPDMVVGDTGSNQITVFLAVAAGLYGPKTVISGVSAPNSVVLADLTHTGKLDIVATSAVTDVVTVLANNGAGVFSAPVTVATGKSPVKVVTGDFNGDGNLDLAVAHSAGNPKNTGGVSILLGTGSRTFQAAKDVPTNGVPGSLGVADFNKDGFQDIVVTDTVTSVVTLLVGDGTGAFTIFGNYAVGASPAGLLVADVNADGYADVVTVSSASTSTDNISAILNAAGGGFSPAVFSGLPNGASLEDIALLNLNQDPFPDIIVTRTTGTGNGNNVFTLKGIGQGNFALNGFNEAGGGNSPTPVPSFVAVISDPWRRATTFTVIGPIVNTNLVRNGDFEAPDLSGEFGNLNGWSTFDLGGNPGSRGRWVSQTGIASPINGIAVQNSPTGFFQGMLDESDLIPFLAGTGPDPNLGINANLPSDYNGSHALYQDITIPANATQLILSFSVYIDDSWAVLPYSDTTVTPQLNFNTLADNQQVRVDLMNPNAPLLETVLDNTATNTPGVYQNLYVTDPNQPLITSSIQTVTLDPALYKGKTIRFRVAATNNRGLLVVGVDDVKLMARFSDSAPPSLTGVAVRNVSSIASPSVPDPTTDPTIVGTLSDNGTINNVAFIEIDPKNNGFGKPDDFKITNWDPYGNFSFTIPTDLLLPGKNTISIRAVY